MADTIGLNIVGVFSVHFKGNMQFIKELHMQNAGTCNCMADGLYLQRSLKMHMCSHISFGVSPLRLTISCFKNISYVNL